MQDNSELTTDYIRRLKVAQESGNTRPVPLIDESRVRKAKIMPVNVFIREALRIAKRKGL